MPLINATAAVWLKVCFSPAGKYTCQLREAISTFNGDTTTVEKCLSYFSENQFGDTCQCSINNMKECVSKFRENTPEEKTQCLSTIKKKLTEHCNVLDGNIVKIYIGGTIVLLALFASYTAFNYHRLKGNKKKLEPLGKKVKIAIDRVNSLKQKFQNVHGIISKKQLDEWRKEISMVKDQVELVQKDIESYKNDLKLNALLSGLGVGLGIVLTGGILAGGLMIGTTATIAVGIGGAICSSLLTLWNGWICKEAFKDLYSKDLEQMEKDFAKCRDDLQTVIQVFNNAYKSSQPYWKSDGSLTKEAKLKLLEEKYKKEREKLMNEQD